MRPFVVSLYSRIRMVKFHCYGRQELVTVRHEIDYEETLAGWKNNLWWPCWIYNSNIKEVTWHTFVLESDGITGDILLKTLEFFDVMYLFSSHKGHMTLLWIWKVFLQLPHTTSLWLVGDASEQSGNITSDWYWKKNKLLLWRNISMTYLLPVKNRHFGNCHATDAATYSCIVTI